MRFILGKFFEQHVQDFANRAMPESPNLIICYFPRVAKNWKCSDWHGALGHHHYGMDGLRRILGIADATCEIPDPGFDRFTVQIICAHRPISPSVSYAHDKKAQPRSSPIGIESIICVRFNKVADIFPTRDCTGLASLEAKLLDSILL